MDFFGLGKATSTFIVVGVLSAAAAGVGYYIIDSIGDARESKLRRESVEDRLRSIRDAKEKERIIRNLPKWAKARCAAGRTECCSADLGKLPAECAAPVAGDE